ncbi:MAG: hypothetical protein ABI359_03045 [Ginsengibacter sp.]
MSEVNKNTIHRSKKQSGLKDLRDQKIVFITKSEISPSKTLFPEKLKKINKLLKKAELLP